MKYLAFILGLSTIVNSAIAQDWNLKLKELSIAAGYICGNETEAMPSASTKYKNDKKTLIEKKEKLQNSISGSDPYELTLNIEKALSNEDTTRNYDARNLITLLGAVDINYSEAVVRRLYESADSIAAKRVPLSTPDEYRQLAINGESLYIRDAILSAILLSNSSKMNDILEKESSAGTPLSSRANSILEDLKST
ncbi:MULTISPECIES: hypothetical protein [Pseudomonas aeruginosa group]|uniref:hypothetical protein n=1 Tax=Pseudomonas aeruginosa group TaxID=136841 RepID=UPI000442FB24|nr:hypothetical protein [Pseudomonas aeruginosa]AHW72595.1 hypothetical protein PA96_4114 [Pseudomonas aeruginosa PA96]EJN6723065.1 hypothetical protein [Pseudomonas aeruginosa]EKN9356769.1 hypothetical protein [Pseudomonas aeruginosa]ELP1388594.1 hypothetical protein [Pseudomonas aeruginosa]MBW6174285.1 hypothetical protein [Pseudomonas aeruginosa]